MPMGALLLRRRASWGRMGVPVTNRRGDGMRYIALLRGVNVGGKNKLPMGELRRALGQNGFAGVETYINSGNILFTDDDEADQAALAGRIQGLIEAEFGVRTPVALLSAPELARAMAGAPAWWNNDAEAKHNAIFVIPPLTAEEAFRLVGDIKPEYEKVGHQGKVIFWSAPLKTFSRTRWSKVVGTAAYAGITIRNANTALKLLALAGG